MLLTVEDVADILRVSVSTVRTLIRRGELKTVRVGGQIRVRREDLDEYIKDHTS